MIKILEHWKRIASIDYTTRLMNRDSYTYLPPRWSTLRGQVAWQLQIMKKELLTTKDFLNMYEQASTINSLNEFEKWTLRKVWEEIQKYSKLPNEFLERLSEITSLSLAARDHSRKTGDNDGAISLIEKVIELQLEKADILGYNNHPYNAILNEYEPWFTIQDYDNIFDSILPVITSISKKIVYDKLPINNHWQKLLNKYLTKEESYQILNILKKHVAFPEDMFRIDDTQHPFSEGISNRDVRIGLRLENVQLKHLYHYFLHEFWHSLYDAGSHESFWLTPLVLWSTLWLHESQARFRELCVWHHEHFSSQTLGKIANTIGEGEECYDSSPLHTLLALMLSKWPTRTTADELHYHTHVFIRYQIEKSLFDKSIKPVNLPGIRNDMYTAYFGHTPTSPNEWFLQDIHRREGLFGYFPTYTLGTALAYYRQYIVEARSSEQTITTSWSLDIPTIINVLHDCVTQYGNTYITKKLIEKTWVPFDTSYMTIALHKKYAFLISS